MRSSGFRDRDVQGWLIPVLLRHQHQLPTRSSQSQMYADGMSFSPYVIQQDDAKITFSQIYHPNVDLEGNVCLNILREDWKPVLNLNSVMVGLQYLFLEPNADDPLNKGTSPFTTADVLELTCLTPQRRRKNYAKIGKTSCITSRRRCKEEISKEYNMTESLSTDWCHIDSLAF
jgi:hypothetical protein